MKFEPITYKTVIDFDGGFMWLELVQGDQVVRVSLDDAADHTNGYRWVEIAERVEAIKATVKLQVQSSFDNPLKDVLKKKP